MSLYHSLVNSSTQTFIVITSIFSYKMVPNIQAESSPEPMLTVDEVEKVHRQRIANLVGHVFQLTYAAMLDILIQE